MLVLCSAGYEVYNVIDESAWYGGHLVQIPPTLGQVGVQSIWFVNFTSRAFRVRL